MQRPERRWIGAFVILLGLVGLIAYVGFTNPVPRKVPGSSSTKSRPEIKKFTSEEEFKKYLTLSPGTLNSISFRKDSESSISLEAPMMGIGASDESSMNTRYSETNIQVQGIDEPDIVKTDGGAIYYSMNRFYEYFPLWDRGIMSEPSVGSSEPAEAPSSDVIDSVTVDPVAPDLKLITPIEPYPANQNSTKIITTPNANTLEISSSIDMSGELLVSDSKLIVMSGARLQAYEVSDTRNPREIWSEEFDQQSSIIATRLFNEKLYVTTMHWLQSSSPCPIPLTTGGRTIACTDIYYPVSPIDANTTYTVSVINVATGELEDSVTFVGNQGQSVVYMSPQYLYVTYGFQESQAALVFDFFLNNSADLVSKDVLNRIEQLASYELYEQTKITELYTILENYYNTLNEDERLKLENNIQNRASDYMKAHQRDIIKTGIVQISLSDLTVENTASVPGSVLNQFSLDEYEDNLRIATTTTNSFMFMSTSESVNDLYVLDEDLRVRGSIVDLGISERIYSARFVGDKGYLVTFRQIDPFYVFDLSDPDNPRKTGELKIPGFSSYLHPLTNELVVGIGRDGGAVKATLFNVGNPSNPVEQSTFVMNESWTEVESNHHAFLHDPEHSVFFIPGSNGGYVFSYESGQLELTTAVSNIQAERALYINDYLYVIGREKIVVLDENSWEQVTDLVF